MSTPFLVGLVGARGHTGRELIRLIAGHPELMLAYAVSREFAGRPVSEVAPEDKDECVFEALSPEEVAKRRADVVILAAPDGAAAPYVEAIEAHAPGRIIIDLSADYRFNDHWAYGLPELNRKNIAGKTRIANPGCYATAIQLAIAPLVPKLGGVPSVFGVSGYSGAGTKPSPKNDPERLKDNLMPYALTGHNHERESTRHLGAKIRFTPHVHPAFRGIVVTAHIPLADKMDIAALTQLFEEKYAREPLIALRNAPPELKDGTNRKGVLLGGFTISEDASTGGGGHAVVVAAEDNLLKGAAVQAVQNINLALGLEELKGILQRKEFDRPMAATESDFLIQSATYLGAAAVAVPVFNRLKLGSILGFLAAGVAVGPFGLNLLHQPEGVFHIAELGVVLFLFVIGLELSFSRLWSMRKQIFGLGAAQMTVTGAVIACLFVLVGVMPAPAAAIAGFSLAFSSTAFALQWMKDRGELNTAYGTQSFSVLLFQDLAVIPLLAAVPFVAGAGGGENSVDAAIKAAGVVALVILVGKFGLDRVFRLVASSGSREAFAATALFVVALVSLAVAWAGLSMALGAFLAGALLAESSFKHQIETDIEPFRGLLLGLFFISIGMRLDLGVIAEHWLLVVGGAIGLVAMKSTILYALSRAMGSGRNIGLQSAATLSQGGEFSFVIFTLGVSAALFTDGQASLMAAIVTLSMVLTPLLYFGAKRLARDGGESADGLVEPEGGRDHAIIAGFGRMGQIISQVLQNSGVDIIAIDRNPGHIRNAERFGFKVYYGDGSRLDMLEAAGAADARAIILCMDDPKAVNAAVTVLRERFASVTILAVAHDRMHEIELRKLGPDVIVRETLESSILIARETLSRMGLEAGVIEDYIQQFRAIDRERLLAQIDAGPEAGRHFIHQPYNSPEKSA